MFSQQLKTAVFKLLYFAFKLIINTKKAKMKNPLLVMTIILVVLVVGLVAVTLFAKQKVVMADGTTGKVSYFGAKTSAPAVEEPATEPAV